MRVYGAARPRVQGVARAARLDARAGHLQPAERSVRARDRRRRHLLQQMEGRSCVPARAGAGHCGGIPQDVQGIPATAAAGQLQHRSGAGEGAAAAGLYGSQRRRGSEMTRVTAPPSNAIEAFYTSHPYPPPVANLDRARDEWRDPIRRRAEFHLVWPHAPYRADLDILVAGCGTWQAAKYALCHPDARAGGLALNATSPDPPQQPN